MACELCTDPDGSACFPLYGIGPHIHRPGPILGSTEILEDQNSIEGFTPSTEDPGFGIYWCPHCGDGKP